MSDEFEYRVVEVPSLIVLSDEDLARMAAVEAELDRLLTLEARARLRATEAQADRDMLGL